MDDEVPLMFQQPKLTIEPRSLVAGDTVLWTKTLDMGAPADGTLTYYFNEPVSRTKVGPIVATDNGDGSFLVELPAATTATMAAVEWRYEAYFTPNATTDRYRVVQGRVVVTADYSAAGVDDRTHVEKTLAAIEATIEGKASQDQLMYSIHGRTLQRMSFTELEKFRKDYKRQLAMQKDQEAIRNGKHPTSAVKVRFGGGRGSAWIPGRPWPWPWS